MSNLLIEPLMEILWMLNASPAKNTNPVNFLWFCDDAAANEMNKMEHANGIKVLCGI